MICMHLHLASMYSCICVCMHVCLSIYMHVCVYACVSTHVQDLIHSDHSVDLAIAIGGSGVRVREIDMPAPGGPVAPAPAAPPKDSP